MAANNDRSNLPRTSKIRKSIVRKFNLGNYENMDIIVDQEHTVEWSSLTELMDKSANITKLLTRDFQDTCSLVQEELQASEKKAFLGEYGAPRGGNNGGSLEENDYDSL